MSACHPPASWAPFGLSSGFVSLTQCKITALHHASKPAHRCLRLGNPIYTFAFNNLNNSNAYSRIFLLVLYLHKPHNRFLPFLCRFWIFILFWEENIWYWLGIGVMISISNLALLKIEDAGKQCCILRTLQNRRCGFANFTAWQRLLQTILSTQQ